MQALEGSSQEVGIGEREVVAGNSKELEKNSRAIGNSVDNVVVNGNGSLNAKFFYIDELARKDFTKMSCDDIAILLTRWYMGCEREMDELIRRGITGRWIVENIAPDQFVNFIVDTFVSECNTSFVTVQRIFYFSLPTETTISQTKI
jgi:hypothetical protein